AQRSSGLYRRSVHSGDKPPLVATVIPSGLFHLAPFTSSATRASLGHGAPTAIQSRIIATSVAGNSSFSLGGIGDQTSLVRETARNSGLSSGLPTISAGSPPSPPASVDSRDFRLRLPCTSFGSSP